MYLRMWLKCVYIYLYCAHTYILHRKTAVDLWGRGGVQICTTYLVIENIRSRSRTNICTYVRT